MSDVAARANCYTYAVQRIAQITGGRVVLPATWAEVVRAHLEHRHTGGKGGGTPVPPEAALAAGDLIEMRGVHGDRSRHVAVAIDAFTAVHLDGVMDDRERFAAEISIAVLRRAGLIVRVVRFGGEVIAEGPGS